MNLTDLREQFSHQAQDVPDLTAVRAEADRRLAARSRRRRTRALIAVAAAVIVVTGGVGTVAAVLSSRSDGPIGPAGQSYPVVPVPQLTLPAGTALIPHELAPVESPVSATWTAPVATVQSWTSQPGRLTVTYIPAEAPTTAVTAGYVITARRGDPPHAPGALIGSTVATTDTPTTAAGHPATIQAAPAGSVDATGQPAERRITWQLPNGQWIHVWASDPRDPNAAATFAEGITDTPAALYRSIGIGVTLPGLTADSSVNGTVLSAPAVWLCPPSVQPLDAGGRLGPTDPVASCATAQVFAAFDVGQFGETSTITVDGRTVHVGQSAAWTRLPDSDEVAMFTSPPQGSTVALSAADLAVAAASIRLSPATTVQPPAGGVSPPPTAVTTTAHS